MNKLKSYSLAVGLLCLVSSQPALAKNPAGQLLTGIAAYGLYSLVCLCLVGWSFLVTVLVRPRVELTAQVLQKRPLASFLMGLLSLGWLLLSLVVGEKAGGPGGLLVLVTFSILILCALVGMPAILIGLGRRASALWSRPMDLPREILLGSAIIFTAGGFPWLGQLLLLGLLLWSSGGAVLGFFAESKERDETDISLDPEASGDEH